MSGIEGDMGNIEGDNMRDMAENVTKNGGRNATKNGGKSVTFARPPRPADPDAWVGGVGSEAAAPIPERVPERTPMKRLTLDIPEPLHRRVKTGCAMRGEKIADVVRRYLDAEFPAS